MAAISVWFPSVKSISVLSKGGQISTSHWRSEHELLPLLKSILGPSGPIMASVKCLLAKAFSVSSIGPIAQAIYCSVPSNRTAMSCGSVEVKGVCRKGRHY